MCVEQAINTATKTVKDGCNNTKPHDIVAKMSVNRLFTGINECKLYVSGGKR